MDEQAEVGPILSDIWNVAKPPVEVDDSTIQYEFMEYPHYGSPANETTLRVWSTDVSSYFLLSSAMLHVEFQVKSSASALTVADQTALASNGWCVFNQVRLRLGDEQIAQVDQPGKACQMRNLVELGQDYMERAGQNSHHFIDRTSDAHSASLVARTIRFVGQSTVGSTDYYPRGMYDENQLYISGATDAPLTGDTDKPTSRKNPNFDLSFQRKVDRSPTVQSVFLPLSELFPLCAQYNRVIKGTKIEVECVKESEVARAVFGAVAASGLTLHITKYSLWVARLKPSLPALQMVESQLANRSQVEMLHSAMRLYTFPGQPAQAGSNTWPIHHKQSRPTHAIVGFQYSDRDTLSTLNPLVWDDLVGKISRLELRYNGRSVPLISYVPNNSQEVPRIIHDLHKIGGKDRDPADSPIISVDNWVSGLYNLFAFDLQYTEGDAYESRQSCVLDLKWTLSDTPGATYTVMALLFSEAKSVFDYSSGITTVKTE